MGCDITLKQTDWTRIISIHAARVGCDPLTINKTKSRKEFQSTQPEWAATSTGKKQTATPTFQSTQPEWAATAYLAEIYGDNDISIHAARVGCDWQHAGGVFRRRHFNPRSPSGLRPAGQRPCRRRADFNPRSPSGLRQGHYAH